MNEARYESIESLTQNLEQTGYHRVRRLHRTGDTVALTVWMNLRAIGWGHSRAVVIEQDSPVLMIAEDSNSVGMIISQVRRHCPQLAERTTKRLVHLLTVSYARKKAAYLTISKLAELGAAR